MAAAIDHPNVIPVYEAGEEDGRLYLVMRWVAGTDLHRLLRAEGRIEPERAAAIVNQVAGALDAAHAAGLVHRDVKPANVLLSGEHAYLADFGLTRFAGADTLTTAGHFLGTVDYMAPEQFHPGPERRARRRLRARLRPLRGADRRAAVPARDRPGDDARAPARRAAAGVADRRRAGGLRPRAGARARQGAGGPLPVGRGLRARRAGRRRGALGDRGGALRGARRGGADRPPRAPVVRCRRGRADRDRRARGRRGPGRGPPRRAGPGPPLPRRARAGCGSGARASSRSPAAALAIAVVPGGAGTPPPGDPVSASEVRPAGQLVRLRLRRRGRARGSRGC